MPAKITVNLLKKLSGHQQSVYALALLPDGSVLTGGGEGFLAHWDPAVSDDAKLFARIGQPIYSALYLPEMGVFCGTQSGDLYKINNDKTAQHLRKHKLGIFDIADTGNGTAITCGGDGKAIVWNALGQGILEVQIGNKSLRKVTKTNSGYAFGSSDNTIYLTDTDLQVQQKLEGHDNSVFALAYSTKTGILYSGGRDATIRLWDLHSGKFLEEVNAHTLHVNDLQLSPDGSLLASASMDKTLKIWNATDMSLLKVANAEKYGMHTSSVNRVRWMDNDSVVTVSDDRQVGIWQILR